MKVNHLNYVTALRGGKQTLPKATFSHGPKPGIVTTNKK